MSKVNDLFKSRTIRWVRGIVIMLLAILLAGFPVGYLVKKYVVSHSEEWICRKISIGSLFINPLATSVTITDFRLYEQNSDSTFLSFNELHVNAVGYKLLFKKFQLEELTLDQPKVKFVMTGDALNIDDMLRCLAPKDTLSTPSSTEAESSWGYEIENVNLKSGGFDFYITDFKAGVGLTKIELSCPLISSGQPGIDGFLNFNMVSGGTIRNNFHVRTDSMRYSVAIEGDSVGLGFILPFVDKFMYISDVKGRIDTRLTVGGKFDAAISEAVGTIKLTDFQMLDTAKTPVIGVDRFEIGVDTVSAVKGSYALRHVIMEKPYFVFGITNYGNTLLRSEEGSSNHTAAKTEDNSDYTSFFRMIDHYFVELGKEYAIRYYAIDTLQMTGGRVVFDDYTLNEQVHFLLEDVSFESSKLYSDQDSIMVKMAAQLNHSGKLKAQLVVMPKDTGDLKLDYSIEGLKVSDFSPYSEYYVAHPFWDGVVYYTSHTTILNNQVDSKNHFIIRNMEVGDKVVNKTAYQLPLKLAVSLLKDIHGDVEMTIPVKGNINDPKFKPFPIILKIFRDLIVKAVAAPFKLLARTFNANEDDLKDVKYDYLQFDIRKRQEKSLNLLARILNQKKDLRTKLVHLNNREWEMEQYALFEGKKMFYQERNQKTVLNADDSIAIDQIMRLDSSFLVYLKSKSGLKAVQDVEATCITLVGRPKIEGMMAVVNAKRVTNLTEYLQSKVEGPNRFTVEEANNKDKSEFRDRPRFLILFEAAPDSTVRK